MNKSDISAIVVLYNEHLRDYISKLNTYIDFVSYVCILDNSDCFDSQDEIGCLDNYDVIVEYINLAGNKGIAYALNAGFELCKKRNIKYVITLDQDSSFTDSGINYLNYSFNPEQAIIFPRYIDGGIILNKNEKIQSGAMFSMEHYLKTSGFCEKYFIDFVDYDMFEQLNYLGYSFYVANDIFLTHHLGTKRITGKTQKKYTSIAPIRYFYLFRNGLDFFVRYKKNITLVTLFKLIAKVLFQEEDKRKRFSYVFKGIIAFQKKEWGKYEE